jgi:hypothetical protein
MPLEYVNRQGDRYFLFQGKTKTGKPKYYVSRKTSTGEPVEEMPEGFEFYEQPEQGLVVLRKIRPTRILPEEREKLTAWTREFAGTEYFLVEIQDDSLVVYSPGSDPDRTLDIFGDKLGIFPGRRAETRDWLMKKAVYSAMFRFKLINEKKRLFAVDRWCFKGSIDNWFPLESAQSLEKQARQFLPHLGKESFYELM